jgi:hypothetical protein
LTHPVCPPFLEPRLRLFLSADIVGSTSLKQTRGRPGGSEDDWKSGPVWFSAIQGFYFEAAQAFLQQWTDRKKASELPFELYGEEPEFWKSIGDEVLFVKELGDHRQIATTLMCWFQAVDRMRSFLKGESSSLDVKCTAWVAGFPYRNREVVIGRYPNSGGERVENYYQASGNLLNSIYTDEDSTGLSVDYIGPSIDTGFRLTGFSTSRKMVVSVDVAYLISMTSFDGEVSRIDLNYDGSHTLKGVIGGASYPIFWINMSGSHSLAVKEDKLRAQTIVNREDVREYCDAFYKEYSSFTFRPFIKDDVGQTLAKMPSWYENYHALLVKNFNLPDNEYDADASEEGDDEPDAAQEVDEEEFDELLIDVPLSDDPHRPSRYSVGDAVHHKKFGDGIVSAIDGNKLDVLFTNFGDKRVLDTFVTVKDL